MLLDARGLVIAALCLVPTLASAEEETESPRAISHSNETVRSERGGSKRTRSERQRESHSCLKAPVEIVSAGEATKLSLTRCDGGANAAGVEELSILARSPGIDKPKEGPGELEKAHGTEVAPGIKRLDVRLVERMQLVVDHFRQAGATPRVEIVSTVRSSNENASHGLGRAMDFRIYGVDAKSVVNYCKTLPDTGCGYYPAGGFAHIDVRSPGAGRVSWVDGSRRGDRQHVVAALPAVHHSQQRTRTLPALPAAPHETSEPAAAVLAAPIDGPSHGI